MRTGLSRKTLICLFGLCALNRAQEQTGKDAEDAPPSLASILVQPRPQSMTVTVGKSVLVNSPLPMERVAIGLGGCAEVQAVGLREVLLNGKAPGETSLIIWQEDGSKLLYDVTVQASSSATQSRLDSIRHEIEAELPGQDVHLSLDNDTVFVRGKVKDLTSADRAVAIASTLGKTVNLLYVDVPPAEMQVLLKVKFASVDRNLSDQLGANLFSLGAVNTIGSVSTQQFSPPVIPGAQNTNSSTSTTLSDALNIFLFRTDLNLGVTIKALQAKGLLEVLAEPNVLTENGHQASFLAGGEFPFPVVQGSTGGGAAAVTIQFREFGVRLNFIPTMTPRGSIMLRVAPEVSALDFTHGLNVNGFNVPALSVRKLSTAVELEQGQSFAIGGLLDNRVTEMFQKIPFLGDLPVLGKFFQSRSIQKENTELLVIVTPEVVRPMPKGMAPTELNFPAPFLEANTNGPLTTPGIERTGPVPPKLPYEAIPVETLIKSLMLESPSNPSQQQPLQSPWPQTQPTATPATPAQKPTIP